jgi:excisionase family DNA binding protein
MYVSIQKAAERYDVCQRTVRRKIASGELPAYRFGRSIRIREDDLEAVLRPIPTAEQPVGPAVRLETEQPTWAPASDPFHRLTPARSFANGRRAGKASR